MARIDNLNTGALKSAKRATRRLEAGSPVGFTSVSKGSLEINSTEGLRVNGSSFTSGRMEGSGTFDWTGPMWLRGAITGVGAFTFSGKCVFNGGVEITQTLDVTGPARLRAATTMEATLTVTSGGKVVVGNMALDPSVASGALTFANGAQVYTNANTIQMFRGNGVFQVLGSSAQMLWGGTGITANSSGVAVNTALSVTSTLGVSGKATLGSLAVGGAKQFIIDHPTKPGWKLGHGSTESPVSGIEYWGEGTLGADGASIIELPEYFDALARKFGRIALVTGNGFTARWTRIDGNAFTVSGGQRGDEFTWLVKAERINAGFLVEFVDPDYSLANSAQ